MKLATCSNNSMLQGSNSGLFSSNSCAVISSNWKFGGNHSNLNMKANSSWNSDESVTGQCLASNAARIKDKWMEFQGIKNWEGLLDPLDDGLRDEILRYGEFVEAAYRCFDFDTSSQGYATCRYPKSSMLSDCGVGVAGYKVTKSLHATCGVNLPNWTERIPGWVSTQSSWIGYVAVCNDKAEIARLGRRDVVIAYRGTATCMEWIENLRATLTCLPCDMSPYKCDSMVQSGFLSLYTSSAEGRPSLQDSIRGEINKILQKYADEPLSITVTGHSLGAALATLTAHDINTTFKHAPLVTVVSFGGPRVGNINFRSQLEKNGTKVLRIVNSDDPITKVPGFVLEENAPQRTRNGGMDDVVTGLSNWLQKRMEETQWVYAKIGKELRLSSRDCPHLSNGNVATCHDLKTYLHLVYNFVSSNCPLRATAKRVIEKTSGEAAAFV
ncbi:phospholipase A(1) DAD1, chloroplastic-like [Primulina eburnea]|uniref:phospholipase A(1) DAD1, chloroplastic-like n=1 Tax=Primulina eburnea TaxID=1245227 RepID=UPI003C6CA424